MNRKERVVAAMNNQPTDFPAVGLWYHFPAEIGNEGIIRETLRDAEELNTDIIKIMSDGYFNYPNPMIEELKTPADWMKFKPLGKDHPWIRGQVERVARIKEALGDSVAIFYNVFNPMSYLRFQTDDRFVMDAAKEGKDELKNVLHVMADDVKALAEGILGEAGADGLYYCLQNAEKWRFSVDEYRDIVAPSELEALKVINEIKDFNILHCCGWAGDPNNMEVWKDYPSKAVNWAVHIEGMDLIEGKEFFVLQPDSLVSKGSLR